MEILAGNILVDPKGLSLMPLPDTLARFNRIVTNRLTKPFAGRLRGFAVVHHKGRRSGRSYETPVNIFALPDGYIAALTYGRDRDWVKNVMAAGGCELETRGKIIRVGEPMVVHDPDRGDMPPGVRQILGLIGVTDFLHLTNV
jgi:deazaflavin-dependent oxidoreductase (nitroreductase family)